LETRRNGCGFSSLQHLARYDVSVMHDNCGELCYVVNEVERGSGLHYEGLFWTKLYLRHDLSNLRHEIWNDLLHLSENSVQINVTWGKLMQTNWT
jgi:hypothetical protein